MGFLSPGRMPVTALLFTIAFPLGLVGARAAGISVTTVAALLNMVFAASALAGPLVAGALDQLAGDRFAYLTSMALSLAVVAWMLRRRSAAARTGRAQRIAGLTPCRRQAGGALEQRLQAFQITAVRTAHGGRDQRRPQPRESGRLAAVGQAHPSAAVRHPLPGVGRLHRERPLIGAHHQPHAGLVLPHLIGVGQAPAQELGDEGDPRPHP